jgi:hypothetical protein
MPGVPRRRIGMDRFYISSSASEKRHLDIK